MARTHVMSSAQLLSVSQVFLEFQRTCATECDLGLFGHSLRQLGPSPLFSARAAGSPTASVPRPIFRRQSLRAPKLGPVYHRGARGTIRWRVARWEDIRHELFGQKSLDDMASPFASNPFHRRRPLSMKLSDRPRWRSATADLVQHESSKRIFPHRGDDRLGT